MDPDQKVLMNKYDFGHKLGEGNFAKVYHGRNRESGQNVAIKVIDKMRVLKGKLIDQTKREITVMGIIKHPNVVQLYEVMATKTKIYYIMEYVKGGELFQKVAQGRLNENAARKYFIELISALDVCHNRGVYHRDLKLENLLLDENDSLKVTDFGLSAVTESKRPDGFLHTACGTPAYVAPEVIKRNGYDGDKSDIWSCGVILFVMMAGYLPFQDMNIMGLYLKIYEAEYKCPNWFPSDLRRLLSKILDPNPYTRISISRIRNSSWFKKGYVNNPKIGEIEDMKTSSSENDSVVATTTNIEFPIPASLNAFDIISFSSGFNLSGLFRDRKQRDESQFASMKPVPVIVSKLEEVFKEVEMKFVKKENGLFSFDGNEDMSGHLCIDMEIFELTPLIHLVEMKLSQGNTYEYQRMLNMYIKPALKDIVCVWQGEKTAVEKRD